MGLLQRLKQEEEPLFTESTLTVNEEPTPTMRFEATPFIGPQYYEVKEKIHRLLIDRLDLKKIDTVSKDELREQVREAVESLMAEETEMNSEMGRERLADEILNEIFGLGPLEPLLTDPTISDILVNTYKRVYVERFGKLERTQTVFKDDPHLLHIIDRIVSQVGRRVDESSPMVDARLPDGSRVNAVIAPLALDGPILSIRKFSVRSFTMQDMISHRSITSPMAALIQGAVKSRLNIVVSGGTGSGKTTFLNVLSHFIPVTERIVTIEDAAELKLQQDHVVRLETRPSNIEGKGAITQRDLVRNALRMRPDRIIVGEVRGAEALDMLQAMNTGHDGSLSTMHANSPRDALRRLETMILLAGANLTDRAMREQISSAIDLVIQIARFSDGTRKVVKVTEITGMEGDTVSLQDIFCFEKIGVREDGKILGAFTTTGIMPKCMEQLEAAGVRLPPSLFEPGFEQEDEESTL